MLRKVTRVKGIKLIMMKAAIKSVPKIINTLSEIAMLEMFLHIYQALYHCYCFRCLTKLKRKTNIYNAIQISKEETQML